MTATDDGAALLGAILAQPDEDTPRLVYADWLEENGDPDFAAYIRRGVAICYPERLNPDHDMGAGWDGVIDTIAQYPPQDPDHCPLCLALAQQRVDEHTRAIASDIGRVCGKPADWSGRRDVGVPNYVGVACRGGFAHRITCTAADWLAHADAILAAHPVTKVRLTTLPELTWHAPKWGELGYYTIHSDPQQTHIPLRSMGVAYAEAFQARRVQYAQHHPTEVARAACHARWPRVAFELPG